VPSQRSLARMCVARFRLRFLLQELDLVGPRITLGRSSECQITLEDPLVSRVHAELLVTDSYVRVRDLGSRNGVRVNGALIEGSSELRHNDRLRLGSQDLVFLALGGGLTETARSPRVTGPMAHCKHCSRPFPGESSACPHCGTSVPFGPGDGPETITGVELAAAPSWTFRLIAEVIERALVAGRAPEAERMLERAARDIDARVTAHRAVGREQVLEAANFALRLARLKMRPEWAAWAIRLCRAERVVPNAATIEQLESLDAASLLALGPELQAMLAERDALVSTARSGDELLAEQRISALVERATG
jgi:hypothetical protein